MSSKFINEIDSIVQSEVDSPLQEEVQRIMISCIDVDNDRIDEVEFKKQLDQLLFNTKIMVDLFRKALDKNS